MYYNLMLMQIVNLRDQVEAKQRYLNLLVMHKHKACSISISIYCIFSIIIIITNAIVYKYWRYIRMNDSYFSIYNAIQYNTKLDTVVKWIFEKFIHNDATVFVPVVFLRNHNIIIYYIIKLLFIFTCYLKIIHNYAMVLITYL